MPAPKSPLFLVKSVPKSMKGKRAIFRTDQEIPESGIYRVMHRKHRLPHEVTLLKDQQFPRCARCQDAVTFQLIRGVLPSEVRHEFSTHIRLYELPVLEDEEIQKAAI